LAANSQSPRQFHDGGWGLTLIANVIGLLIVPAVAWDRVQDANDLMALTFDFMNSGARAISVSTGIGVSLGVLLTIGHSLYCGFAPKVYIRYGLIIGVFVAFALVLYTCVAVTGTVMVFPLFTAFLAIMLYCLCSGFIRLSAGMKKQAAGLVRMYPSIIALCVVESLVEILFMSTFLAAVLLEWSGWA
jgi:hypothetical protein